MSSSDGPSSGGPVLGARIMGLKFMQRRMSAAGQQQQASASPSQQSPHQGMPPPPPPAQQRRASDAAAGAAASPQVDGVASTSPKGSDAEWTLEAPAAAVTRAAPRHVLHESEADLPGSQAQLVGFQAGRRSFGAFNPRLEKRLAEIRTNQHAAETEAAQTARAEAERLRRQEERDAIVRADDEFDAKVEAVSDGELAANFAAKYGKFVPREAAALPEVANPVRVRDAPIGQPPPKNKKARRSY